MIRGIHHLSRKCGTMEEWAAWKAFYAGLLGLPIVREWPEGVMIDTGAGLIEVFSNGKGEKCRGAIRHFALAVDDADHYAALIEQAGYELLVRPKDLILLSDPPLRARIAFCLGPLGEQIELFQEL